MPKIDLDKAPSFRGSMYPKPYDEPCRGRAGLRLGIAAGLTQFGVNLVTLEPGAGRASDIGMRRRTSSYTSFPGSSRSSRTTARSR